MRTIYDVHRSLMRCIADTLPDFDVLPGREAPLEDRPYAVVTPVSQPIVEGVAPCIDWDQPFSVYIYPPVEGTFETALMRRLQVEEDLFQTFVVDDAWRMPLYDYEGIGWDQAGPEQPGVSAVNTDGDPVAYDHVEVKDYQVVSARDAEDERRWSITLTLRLAWRRHGRLVFGQPTKSVTVGPDPNNPVH